MCRISPDGERIVFYEPEGGKGIQPDQTPPPLPQQGTDQIFSFENLPEKHWKKYMYAYKFVDLIRAKTPKVTYYTDKAKCLLMENLVDFEACFFEGGKVTQSTAEGITIIDSSGMKYTTNDHNECDNLPPTMELLWSYSQDARNQCVLLECTLSKLPGSNNFPIIVGRRPISAQACKENQSQAVMVNI